jgi:hypothetical protein
MPEGTRSGVHRFEGIDVERENAHARRIGIRLLEGGEQTTPVGQAGQRVALGLVGGGSDLLAQGLGLAGSQQAGGNPCP